MWLGWWTDDGRFWSVAMTGRRGVNKRACINKGLVCGDAYGAR